MREEEVEEGDEVYEDDDEIPVFFEEEEENISDKSSTTKFILKALFKWQSKYSVTDSCILSFFKLLKIFLLTINLVVKSEYLENLIIDIPETLYSARQIIGLNRDDFKQYVVCSKCYAIYDKKDSLLNVMGKILFITIMS